MLGSAAMVAGPAYNDAIIARDPGRGIATVTSVTWLRTNVEYQDEKGRFHSPPYGLLYPSGLGQGQQVWVTYAKDDPDIVKVEGRDWTLALIPALSVAVGATLIAAVAWYVVSALSQPGRAQPARSQSGKGRRGENSPTVPVEETSS